MSENHRTEYSEDALRVTNGTQPDEVHRFVVSRATNPHSFGEITVWNFNNHTINEDALKDITDELLNDEYVIPHQASGVWGYMISLLPVRIRDAETLTYRQWEGSYQPYPNYYRHVDDYEKIREEISDILGKKGI